MRTIPEAAEAVNTPTLDAGRSHGAANPAWRDPSGWRPTALQMSTPSESTGIPYDEWFRKTQPVVDKVQMKAWLAIYGPDAPARKRKA